MNSPAHNDEAEAGLCASCAHSHTLDHPRGGTAYWRCKLADTDERFARYPRIPVRSCPGFEKSKGPAD